MKAIDTQNRDSRRDFPLRGRSAVSADRLIVSLGFRGVGRVRHPAVHPAVYQMQPTHLRVSEAEELRGLPCSSDGEPCRAAVVTSSQLLLRALHCWPRVKVTAFFPLEYLRFEMLICSKLLILIWKITFKEIICPDTYLLTVRNNLSVSFECFNISN